MKVTSLIFATMSGKMAGIVASRNRYGGYIRNKSIPVNPQSYRQDAVRSLMQFATNYWNATVMAAQRAAWNLYAQNVTIKDRTGNPQHITGFNMFLRSSAVVWQARGDHVLTAPAILSLPEVDPTAAATISAATQMLSISFDRTLPWATEASGGDLVVYMGQPILGNREFFKGPWRLAGAIAGTVPAPGSPHTLSVPFPVAAGQRVYVRMRVVRADSRVSEPFLCRCTVSA